VTFLKAAVVFYGDSFTVALTQAPKVDPKIRTRDVDFCYYSADD